MEGPITARARASHSLAALLVFCVAMLVGTWPLFSRPWTAVFDPVPVDGVNPLFTGFLAGVADDPSSPGVPDQETEETTPPGKRSALVFAAVARLDVLLNIWTLAWGTRALSTAPLRFFDANTLYPTPGALTFSDHQLGLLPWFSPFYVLTGNPVLAYQLALFWSAVAGAFFFHLLVTRWTGRPTAGVVAGLVSIFAPFHLHSLRVLVHYSIQYVPAALLCVDLLFEGRRRWLAALGVAMCMTLQALCSVYMVYTTFLLVPIYALGAAVTGRHPERLRALGWFVGASMAAGALVLLAYLPYVAHAAAEWAPRAMSWDARSPVYPPSMRMKWAKPAGATLWRTLTASLGTPLLAVAALGLLQRHARRRTAVVGILALGLLLQAGPTLTVGSVTLDGLPWYWLARWVPGFVQQRHQYVPRIMVGVGLVCLVGLGWAWLVDGLSRRGAWTARRGGAAIALGLLALSFHQLPVGRLRLLAIATGARVPPVYRWLARHGEGKPLLELPPLQEAAYAYFSTYHWLPLFNGPYAIPPPGYVELHRQAWTVLDAERADSFLEKVPVEWIIVHGALLPAEMRAAIAQPPPHLELVERFGADVLFRVKEDEGAARPSE